MLRTDFDDGRQPLTDYETLVRDLARTRASETDVEV